MISDNLNSEGVRVHKKGEFRKARRLYREAIKLDPDNAQIAFNLGRVYQDMEGYCPKAVAWYRKSVQLDPKFAPGWANLGMCLEFSGRHNEAMECYVESVQVCPTIDQYNNLGVILGDKGQTSASILCFLEALRRKPDYSEGLLNLVGELNKAGRTDEAMKCFRKAMELNPKHQLGRSNVLFAMQHLPTVTAKEVYDEHIRWAQMHVGRIVPHSVKPPPFDGRRIRVGYVSGDFKEHVVASNLDPVLTHHDHGRFEIFMYSNLEIQKNDKVTKRFKKCADQWRDTITMSDERMVKQIMDDKIDILVDLSGHTANNRLTVFAHRPAPIQVSYLGYVSTTGMKSIDYRLTDALIDPPGSEQYYVEKLVRVPGSSCVYRPFDDADAPLAESPWLETKPTITLGSFNNVAKTTPEVVKAWSRIMVAHQNTVLFLKARTFQDEGIRERFKLQFKLNGVQVERIVFCPWTKGIRDHMSCYNYVDLLLDTFPFTGGITSFEGLYMGVPLVTLAGEYMVRRMSARLLTEIGLPQLITNSVDEYVDLANHLLDDPRWLVEWRHLIRDRLKASSLMDGEGLCRKIESVYEKMTKGEI